MKVRTRLKRRTAGRGQVSFLWQLTPRRFVRIPARGRLPPVRRFPAEDNAEDGVCSEAEHYRRNLVASGRLLDADAFRAAKSLTRADVQMALDEKRFFVVDVDGLPYYPAFFTNDYLDRNTLEAVSLALGDLCGWLKWDFFTTARGSLGDKSPFDLIALGDVERVIARAKSFWDEVLR
ncbi:hypothetical protein [Paraburkholderia phytofirmans]|uniref:Antitoxin Xre/MbcA/ParS-like toxin-binding domain-containing protein n=1 Tax=Paraburkholderia phytofirmans (strain DSM 17436 / LMG 22146 / PsJN) TaxID=398527 RepID=B2T7G9_PARPJ|nr:hypothetical protein [Paraburkholderia phytofirmans]ACD18250.1 hypothetical protein Bphyt_3863 [Paraburkholderia phytofirmans PsJN]